MRRIVTMMMLVFAASFTAISFAGQPVAVTALPDVARQFLTRHFPGDNVLKAEKDQGRRGIEYEVDLESGAEVEFDADGNWKDVKAAKGEAVPSAIIPEGISSYVKDNHPRLSVVEISRKRGGYEAELSDGRELHLTADGKKMQPRDKGGRRPY